jgi:tRNA A-37 threonylcarbamoyl transferase component Bud32
LVCPECGTNLPADAPEGLCPQCLLRGVIGSAHEAIRSATPEATAAYAGPGTAPAVAELAPLFPQLEMLELIGQGGMGAVYKARQPSLDRLVAVKVLPPELGRDPAFAERFGREARALARLSHPNIVAVHDVGKAGDYYYFVMEYVEGVNLRQVLRDGKLRPEHALRLVPQICDALQYAHEEGVVHRDVKPENILLDRKGRVKIADFGLAKLLGRDTGNFTLTGSRQVMGTLYYMAPEQVERPLEVDHRADIYSLGVVFYEMLTGQLPVGRFAMPSEKAVTDAFIDEVVLHALERDPARRYQHASEIKTDVQSVGGGATQMAWGVSRDAEGEDLKRELAVHQLSGPAYLLGGAAVAGMLASAAVLGVFAFPPRYKQAGGPELTNALIVSLIGGGLVIAGAWMMKRLRAYEFAVIASVLALLPVTTFAWPMSFVAGVWALWILRKPEVQAAFAGELRRSLRARAAAEQQRASKVANHEAAELGQRTRETDAPDKAEAYARTARAAGLIGLIVPIVVGSLTIVGTIIAALYRRPGEDIATPLTVAWSVAGAVVVVVTVGSLNVIRRLRWQTRDGQALARAGRAAGAIGLFVPLVVVSLAVVGTIVAVLNRSPGEEMTTHLIVAWSIVAAVVLVVIVQSLKVIAQLPQPAEGGQPKLPGQQGKRDTLPAAVRVRRPATALLVTGGVHTGLQALFVLAMFDKFPPNLPSNAVFGVLSMLSLFVGPLIVIGAVNLLNLRSHGWALAGAILALLPCGPSWLLVLPAGLAALAVLTAPDVKAAFARHAP